MKLRFFLILFCIQTAFFCSAQSKLTGFVCDSLNKALPDANVIIFKNDSVIAGISTNAKGNFTLGLDTGKYVIHITHLGYSEYTDTVFLHPAGLTLPAIILKESDIELSEATVIAERATYESHLNKDVFNVSSRVKKSASDVYQILANVPSLTVDPGTRSIRQLAGANNFIVMVNNIRRNDDYLMLLKPEEIERIEINRYPGMRYKGIDAIINIVSKAPASGQRFFIYGQLNPLLKSGSTNGSYSYITEKLRISFVPSTSFTNENNGDLSVIRDATIDNQLIHTEKNSSNASNQSNYTNLSTTIDYTPSAKTFATLYAGYKFSKGHNYKSFTGSVFTNNQKDYDFESFEDQRSNRNTLIINPYFQTNLTKNFQVNAEIKYQTGSPTSDFLSNEINTRQDSSKILQIQREHWNIVEGQVNFEQQLSKINLEEGYRLLWSGDDMNVNTNGYSDETTHNDLRNYFYINALGSIGKRWVYQAGTGFDATQVHLDKQ